MMLMMDQNPNIEMRTNFISDIAVGMLHLHNENIVSFFVREESDLFPDP
jgi:hypothetical protein